MLLLTLSFVFVTMPATYLPLVLKEEFQIRESTSAIIISSSMFAYVGACFLSPKIDDRFDSRLVQVVSYFVFLISSIFFSFIIYLPPSMIPVAGSLFRAISGFSSGIYENLFSTCLVRSFDQNIGCLSAAVDIAVTVGTLSGPLVGGALYNWTKRFSTSNVLPIIPASLIYIWFVFLNYKAHHRDRHRAALKLMSSDSASSSSSEGCAERGSFCKVLNSWQMCLLFFQPFYFSLISALPITILGPFLWETYGASSVTTGVLFMMVSVGYFVGVTVAGILTDIPRLRTLALWLFALTPFMFGLGTMIEGPATFIPLRPSIYVHGSGFALVGIAFGLGCGAQLRLLLEMWKGLYPDDKADYTGYITSFFLVTFSLGEAVGNAIGGWLYAHLTFQEIITYFGLTLFLHGLFNTLYIVTQYNSKYLSRLKSTSKTSDPYHQTSI